MDLLQSRDPVIPLCTACRVLNVPRATAYRHLQPKHQRPIKPRPPSHRRLPEKDRVRILDVLHSNRFIDQTPRQVYAELLDEGQYLASIRTMYRVLKEAGETKERRNQRVHCPAAVPRLTATRPNEVWTWDISKLATCTKGEFLNLYLVLDLYSRFPVAWMVAKRENSALAKQLIAQAYTRHGILPGEVTLHNDRGAPMTALGFMDLLAELKITRSVSRPRISNDNPYSESAFKTIKAQLDYPGRFASLAQARHWCQEFFDWYAYQHRHSGLALFTPSDVFHRNVPGKAAKRQHVLDDAYNKHPERFVKGPPKVDLPPPVAAINPLDSGQDAFLHRVYCPAEDDPRPRSECQGFVP